MKKRNLVIANWKMNPETLEEAKDIFNDIKKTAATLRNTDVVICPPNLFLNPLISSRSKISKNLLFGAQNIAVEHKGAFTGEVSARMVKNIGAKFSIVGHSERRKMGETNEIIQRKLQMSFDAGLTPIFCIGEKERDGDGFYLGHLKDQIKEGLSGLQKKNLVGIIIAYEPVWAIGKSWRDAMNPTDVHEVTIFIRKTLGEYFGKDIAGGAKILYGAAVEPENAKILFDQGNIEGLLVGHASLVPEQFGEILRAVDAKR